MERWTKRFEKWYAKYLQKKPHFKQVIDRWESSGWIEMHKRGSALLADAERQAARIREGLQNDEDHQVLKKDIKKFQKTYKELHESTKPSWRQWIEAIVIALVAVVIMRNFLFGLYHVPSGSAEPTLLVGDRVWGNKMAYLFGDTPQYGDSVMFDNPTFVYDRHNNLTYLWQKYVGFGIPLLGLPNGPDNWVKRVIAIPGDTIEGRVENGKTAIYRNGKKLNELYLNPFPLISLEKRTGFIDLDSIGPLPIPDFLKVKHKFVWYTFDPEKSLGDQPFYNMRGDEIVYKPGTTQRWLKWTKGPTMGPNMRIIDEFGPFKLPPGKYWVMGDSRRNSTDSRVWLFLDESYIHGRASFVIFSIDSEEPFWFLEVIKHPLSFWTRNIRWDRFFKSIVDDNTYLKNR